MRKPRLSCGPLPTLLNIMQEARWWAKCADRDHLKAYTLAGYDELSECDQEAFLHHITMGRENE